MPETEPPAPVSPGRGATPAADRIIDSDVDLHDESQRERSPRGDWDILAAMAAGGVLGAEARYGLSRAVPHHGAQFPWSTVIINTSGCLLLGALMVVLLELLTTAPRLGRPFLGVGVLGGYTTFSTFAVDAHRLLAADRPGMAASYLATTVALGALGVQVGTSATRWLGRRGASGTPASGRR